MSSEKVYTPSEIEARLTSNLPHWQHDQGHLCRVFKTTHWKSSMLLANAIGFLAEAAWHHPDLTVSWGQVEVRLMTHSAGGITDKDFALAGEIDRLIAWQPPSGSGLEGVPDDPRWRYLAGD
jgi:pterin-4a-carbinolamine dehydratase